MIIIILEKINLKSPKNFFVIHGTTIMNITVHISITATCELVIVPSSNNLLPIIFPPYNSIENSEFNNASKSGSIFRYSLRNTIGSQGANSLCISSRFSSSMYVAMLSRRDMVSVILSPPLMAITFGSAYVSSSQSVRCWSQFVQYIS